MPAGKSKFKDELRELFEKPKSSEAESIDDLANAITNYLMTTVIVGVSPSEDPTKPKILQKAKEALAGLNTPGMAQVKLGSAIVQAASPIIEDPAIAAVAVAVLGPPPQFTLALGSSPSEAATEISESADAKIKTWSATNSATGATVKWI